MEVVDYSEDCDIKCSRGVEEKDGSLREGSHISLVGRPTV